MSDHRVNRSPSPFPKGASLTARGRSTSLKRSKTASKSQPRQGSSCDESRKRQVTPTGTSLSRQSGLTRPPTGSVRLSVVGPIKTYIRKETNKATDLHDEIRRTIGDLVGSLPQADEDRRRHILELVQAFLLRAERAAHRVQALPAYISTRLQKPEIARSRDKDQYADEISSVLSEQHTDRLLQQLSEDIARLTTILMDHRYEISHFDPIVNAHTGLAPELVDTEDIPSSSAHPTTSHQPPVSLNANRCAPVQQETAGSLQAHSEQLQSTIRRLEASTAQALAAADKRMKDLEEEAYYRNLEFQQRQQARSTETVATGGGFSANTAIPHRTAATTANTPSTSAQSAKPQNFKSYNTYSEDSYPSATETLLMNMHSLMRNLSLQQKEAIDEVHKMKTQVTEETAKSLEVMEALMNQKLTEHVDALLTRIDDLESAHGADAQIEAHVQEYENIGEDIDAEEPEEQEPIRQPLAPTPSRNKGHDRNDRPTPNYRSYSPDYRFDRHTRESKQLSLDAEVKHIKAFDGTGNYDLFKATYMASVMNHASVDPIHKYAILTDKLTGDAATCLASLLSPEASVIQTFVNLDEIYGNQNDKYNLIAKLNRLRFHPTDTRKMRLDIISHHSLLVQLRAQGVPANDDRVTMALVAKLPPSMRARITAFMTDIGDSVTFDQIFERIKILIKRLEMDQFIMDNYQSSPQPSTEIPDRYESVHLTNAITQQGPKDQEAAPSPPRALAYDASKHRSSYYDPVTKTKLEGYYAPGSHGLKVSLIHRTFPFTNEEDCSCGACDGAHNSMRCPLTSTEFREAAKARGLCPLCNRKHPIDKCRSILRCGYCDGLHHMGGCPRKEFYRDPKNYPKEAKPVSTLFRAARATPKKK